MDEKKLTDEKAFTLSGITEWLSTKAKTDEDMYYCGAIAGTYLAVERQKAEIERLTEELEVKKKECREIADDYQEMGTFYYNETVKTAELQKQVDELTEENGRLEGYNSGLKYENLGLQKQVDELQDRLASVLVGIKADELLVAKGIEQAVKDTAKEIISFVEEKDKKAGKYSIYSKLLQELKERYGVEVE